MLSKNYYWQLEEEFLAKKKKKIHQKTPTNKKTPNP